jgi:hypothetical protein
VAGDHQPATGAAFGGCVDRWYAGLPKCLEAKLDTWPGSLSG